MLPSLLLGPRRERVKLPELLSELERLRDHSLLARIISALDKAGEREILAQRMAPEAVVGEDAPQIGVSLCVQPGDERPWANKAALTHMGGRRRKGHRQRVPGRRGPK